MAKFVKGNQLNAEIESLFEEADMELIIVSPFIKLHDRIVEALKPKVNDPKLHVSVVYGKNETDKKKSLREEDFLFFSQFANIQIFYEPRLHAKYYANEDKGILSSMNLYDFSQNNNIEFGVVSEFKLLGSSTIEEDSRVYFNKVIDGAQLEFSKDPQYEKNLIGLKKYTHSEISKDDLSSLFGGSKSNKTSTTKSKQKENELGEGFCIRTGEPIPFDVKMPYSKKAFQSWNYFKNDDFEEKYCHFTGEPSEGKTSMNKPILSKNWVKAKRKFNL